MSPAPPRKRLSRSHEESSTGAASPTASGASITDEVDPARSTSCSNSGYHVRLGQPIRGRKAMELAAKLEMSSDNDRKRDQLEKKLLYLERNRAASQRSRDKKKKIMGELRDKNRVIDSRNKQLEVRRGFESVQRSRRRGRRWARSLIIHRLQSVVLI